MCKEKRMKNRGESNFHYTPVGEMAPELPRNVNIIVHIRTRSVGVTGGIVSLCGKSQWRPGSIIMWCSTNAKV